MLYLQSWHILSVQICDIVVVNIFALNCVIIAARTQKGTAMFENKSRFINCVRRLLWWSGHWLKKKKSNSSFKRSRWCLVRHTVTAFLFFLSLQYTHFAHLKDRWPKLLICLFRCWFTIAVCVMRGILYCIDLWLNVVNLQSKLQLTYKFTVANSVESKMEKRITNLYCFSCR